MHKKIKLPNIVSANNNHKNNNMTDYDSPDGIYEPYDYEELDLLRQLKEDKAMEDKD